jgi:hypothetical protein
MKAMGVDHLREASEGAAVAAPAEPAPENDEDPKHTAEPQVE